MLCTVECPGSGMALWVHTGAKSHPPHIVLSVDVPPFLVPIGRTSALPSPSRPGRPPAQFQPQPPSAWGSTVVKSRSGQGQLLGMLQLLSGWPVSDLYCLSDNTNWAENIAEVQISVHAKCQSCCASVLHCGGISSMLLYPALNPWTLNIAWESISFWTAAWLLMLCQPPI